MYVAVYNILYKQTYFTVLVTTSVFFDVQAQTCSVQYILLKYSFVQDPCIGVCTVTVGYPLGYRGWPDN